MNLSFPRLYPILDVERAAARGHDLVACARQFTALGCDLQQLRAKTLPARDFLAFAERLVPVVPRLVVNDRADIAQLAGAWGVHLGQDDLPLEPARRFLGDGIALGFSTHNQEQARAAAAEHPDYLTFGPVFPTTTKLNPDPIVGLDRIRHLRGWYAGRLVAIGGITVENAASVIEAGANSVAVIGALWDAPSPAAAAERFLLEFKGESCHSPQESPSPLK